MDYIISTKEDIENIQALDDGYAGLPAMGRHVGGGRHVPMDPTNPDSPGWTKHRLQITKHPTKEEYSIGADESVSYAIDKTQFKTLLLSKKALTVDWKIEAVEAVETPIKVLK